MRLSNFSVLASQHFSFYLLIAQSVKEVEVGIGGGGEGVVGVACQAHGVGSPAASSERPDNAIERDAGTIENDNRFDMEARYRKSSILNTSLIRAGANPFARLRH